MAAGERVLDVQPKLGVRVRVLATGSTNKNDRNDARSVAVAALRSTNPREVTAEDHAAVMKLWAKRRRDLGSARTQVACRLHAVICELVPGGISKEITAAQAAKVLDSVEPSTAVGRARYELAVEFLEDLCRIDAQMRDPKKRLELAVAASGSTTTEIFGVGPYVAATVIGYVGDVSRFANRDHFAAYNGTAPIEVSSGNRKIAEGKTHKEAVRSLKRRISDAIFARVIADARRAAKTAGIGPGGQPGNDSDSSAAGSHPEHRLFGQATPGPEPTIQRQLTPKTAKVATTTMKKVRRAS